MIVMKCPYDSRIKTYRGKMKAVGRVIGQTIGVIYPLLHQNALFIASAEPGSEIAPQLYDHDIHHKHRMAIVKRAEPTDINIFDNE